jgi:NAD(P)-dependent dehydrogenase (short-subunit alcohol dehydrogenase family)
MGGGVINFADLQAEQHFDGWQAYANSKLANVLASHWFAQQLEGTGVVSNSLCPGLIDTNFLHTNNLFSDREREFMRDRMRTPEEGALVPLYLATSPEAETISGKFFVREGRDGRRALSLNWDQRLEAELVTQSFGCLKGWCQAPQSGT